MERTRWTDERLDDFAGCMSKSFDALREDNRALRVELIGEMRAMRTELVQANARLGADVSELKLALIRASWAVVVVLIAAIASIVVAG